MVWSPELAYAIGLIATDGCLSKDGRHLDFTSKDKDQILALMRCLHLEHLKIGLKNRGQPNEAFRVQWGSVLFYTFLLDIGLMPNKSKVLGALNVPDEYFFDFLRGHFDGDGSFYSYYDPRWKNSFMFYLTFLSASAEHIRWLRESIQRLGGVRGHISLSGKQGHKMSSLRYAKKEALRLLVRLYPNKKTICLRRKRLKIERALGIVGESLPGNGKRLTM